MNESLRTQVWWVLHLFLTCLISAGAGIAHADISDTNSAASLRAKYMALRDVLSHNQFQLPLNLDSSQSSTDLKGDIYALMDYPFATVSTALKGATNWCDILILHLNVKYCRASADKPDSKLTVHIGSKNEQSLSLAPQMEFEYRVNYNSSDYLQIFLDADKGPFGTKKYRFVLEAIPLKDGGTFIHLSYSYVYGFTAKFAMQAYLKTLGSDKVGFTIIKRLPNGKPLYVSGIRGALERNTMRYYLAINAYLGALSTPPQQQLDKRLRDWFAFTERYPIQLHELEQNEYIDMKRKEYKRQQVSG
ncbi:MAG: hypothetical protein ABIR84_05445 [Candidatus Nitrotoga sp.]